MYKVTVNNAPLTAQSGELLKDFFIRNNIIKEHPCAGRGVCKKCLVTVNSKTELSCQYHIHSDITVETDILTDYENTRGSNTNKNTTDETALCLDLGTTTLALALVNTKTGEIIEVVKAANPQRIYGTDIISRIDYCKKSGVEPLRNIIVAEINTLINSVNPQKATSLYVSANTTMLHILAGKNPKDMGIAPYTPAFLEEMHFSGSDLGINNITQVILLPSVSAFMGADALAGIYYAEKPCNDKYNLLVDLGTNAEIMLFSKEKIYCTSAAAGPCFEGGNITYGAGASNGAIYKYSSPEDYGTIGGNPPSGICGTGLIDIVAYLLKENIADKTGYMKSDYLVAPNIYLTPSDIREFQLAKSAVCAAITTLMKLKNITYADIETVFISGGFSSEFNIKNALQTGLIPKEFTSRYKSIGNSSLLGAVKYACQKTGLYELAANAEYIDLTSTPVFSDLFIENMGF